MHMILPDFLVLYSYRALLPADHDLQLHIYLCECQEMPEMHNMHQYQDTWGRRRKKYVYKVLMTLTIRDDVNGRCCKKDNSPDTNIMHALIYIPTCTTLMDFAIAKYFGLIIGRNFYYSVYIIISPNIHTFDGCHVYINVSTCTRIMKFAKAIPTWINIHKLMEAKSIYIYVYLSFLVIYYYFWKYNYAVLMYILSPMSP